jgi:hypothetical protein
MLVFLRKDDRGTRGTRLAGCNHHRTGHTCDRCRDPKAVDIQPKPSDNKHANL